MSRRPNHKVRENTPLYRVYEISNVRTQTELAEVLGIQQSSVAIVHTRGSGVPSTWLIKLYDKFRVNPDWIRYGTGDKYLQGAKFQPHIKQTNLSDYPMEEIMAEVARRLAPLSYPMKCDVLSVVW